ASERISGLGASFYSHLLHGAFWLCLSGFAAALWPIKSRAERLGQVTALLPAVLMGAAAGLLMLGFGRYDTLEFQRLVWRTSRLEAFEIIASVVAIASLASLWLGFRSWRFSYWGLCA